MATAIIERQKRHVMRATAKKRAQLKPATAAAPVCPLESLQHHGLECKLCTQYTVVGSAEIIQSECQVLKLALEATSDDYELKATNQASNGPSDKDHDTIFSPYDALGMAETK